MVKPMCCECQGIGHIFEGAFMRSNPWDYGDYDEIWRPCGRCDGTGRTWKDFSLGWLKWTILNRFRKAAVEEIDIPF